MGPVPDAYLLGGQVRAVGWACGARDFTRDADARTGLCASPELTSSSPSGSTAQARREVPRQVPSGLNFVHIQPWRSIVRTRDL